MGKNQSASNLTNIIKQDASGNIVFTSGSTTLATISTAGQLSGSTAVLSAQTASFVANAQTASFVALAQSASNAVAAATASFANAFTVASTLTAQTLVVQTITSSVDFVTGSTRFGSVIGNTHVFTGSMAVSGGLVVSSTTPELTVGATGVTLGNVITDTHTITGSVGISGSATFSSTLTTGDVITSNTGGFRTLASLGYTLRNDANSANLGALTRRSYWAGNAALDTQIFAETGYGIFINVNGSQTAGLNILSSGNVGIGLTNPTGSLSIKAEQTNTPTIAFQNSSGGPNSAISNYTSAVQTFTVIGTNTYVTSVATLARFNTNYEGSCIIFDEGTLRFSTGTTSITPTVRMTINNTGSVGIGTPTPSYALDINDTNGSGVRGMRISTSSSSVGPSIILRYSPGGLTNWLIGTSQAVSNTLEFIASNSVSGDPGTAGTTRMQITAGGIVSIGTTNTSRNLNVIDSMGVRTNRTGTEQEIFFIGATGSGVNDGFLGLNDNGTRRVNICANNSRGGDTYFNGGGFFGIGMNNPSYTLHIPQGNNLFLSNLFIAGTANNPVLSSGATGGSMYLQGGGAGEGNIYLQGASSGGNGYIEFRTNGSLRMTIASNGNIGAPSGTNIYNASDLRLKQNITAITEGLDKIIALNPVKFNWIDGFEPSEDSKNMLGFVAQELQNVIPEAVENFGNSSIVVGEITVENPLRVNEKFIIPVLVKAIQELNTKLDAANAEIEELKNK